MGMPTDAQQREEYKKVMRAAREGKKDKELSNRFPWQVKESLKELFIHALATGETIRMLCGTAIESFFGEEQVDLLRQCADQPNSCKIKLLLWNETSSMVAPGLMELVNAGKIEMRISGTTEFGGDVPHFQVVGDRAFRQEANHEEIAPELIASDWYPEVPARINFNKPEVGKPLVKFFDDLYDVCPALAS